jgi:hypothetical protein
MGKNARTPYRARKRKANAEPAGGGGGKWRELQNKLNASRTKHASRAVGTQGWVRDKIAEGDIDGGMAANQTGTSIFDPVLCELAYRWFCPPGGLVLDPFAGGSVRGIVASKLGRRYLGIDLRPEQVAANVAQAKVICTDPIPEWKVGDSTEIDKLGESCDFIFTCPPYADLEVYSDDPRDLSTMEHEAFLASFRTIVAKACRLLKPNRFACMVVGDARGSDGNYYGLPWATVEAFRLSALALYNSAVLITAAGSLPIRTAKQFSVSRKLGTTHQHVFVFLKGDARIATDAIGDIEFGQVPEEMVALETPDLALGGEIE